MDKDTFLHNLVADVIISKDELPPYDKGMRVHVKANKWADIPMGPSSYYDGFYHLTYVAQKSIYFKDHDILIHKGDWFKVTWYMTDTTFTVKKLLGAFYE